MWPLPKLTRDPSLPTRTVTRAEFIEAMTALGETLSEAELQAAVNVGLGAETLVGNEYLEIRR